MHIAIAPFPIPLMQMKPLLIAIWQNSFRPMAVLGSLGPGPKSSTVLLFKNSLLAKVILQVLFH